MTSAYMRLLSSLLLFTIHTPSLPHCTETWHAFIFPIHSYIAEALACVSLFRNFISKLAAFFSRSTIFITQHAIKCSRFSICSILCVYLFYFLLLYFQKRNSNDIKSASTTSKIPKLSSLIILIAMSKCYFPAYMCTYMITSFASEIEKLLKKYKITGIFAFTLNFCA